MTPQQMVQEFHRVFGCSVDDLSEETKKARLTLIEEEYGEMLQELVDYESDLVGVDKEGFFLYPLRSDVDREKLAKEMADLVYVIYGSAIAWGIDLDKAVELVHESNMSKVWPDGKPRYRPQDGKVMKPPTYIAPIMTSAVKEIKDV